MIYEFWQAYIFVGLAAFLSALMDWCNFKRPRNSGYWSIHTKDKWDAWHHSRKIRYACFFLWGAVLYLKQPNMEEIITIIILHPLIFGFIVLIVHYIFYHLIFKEIKE